MKKLVLSMMTMLAIVSMSKAQNSLSVADFTLPQNGEASLTVSFQFDAADTYTGYSFDLQIPSDLEFVIESGTDVAYVKGQCHDASHSVTANLSDGVVKVAGLSLSSKPLTGTSGVLLTFTVKPTTDNLVVGQTYQGSISNILIVPVEGNKESLDASNFTITIGDPIEQRTILDETSTTDPEAASGVDVRVNRTINAGNWSTICLPFAMSESQVKAAFGDDVVLADFTGIESTYDTDEETILSIQVNFSQATSIESNHPYLIKVNNNISSFTVDNVNIDPDEASVDKDEWRTGSGTKKDPYVYHYNSFVGTYVADTTVPELCLFLNGNKLWYSLGSTKMKGFRAYFDFYDVLTEVEEGYSAAPAISLLIANGEITKIDARTMREIETGKVYNMTGQYLGEAENMDNLPKGIYIVNGKKVVK